MLLPSVDLRYHGQSFEIEVSLSLETVESGDLTAIAEAFHAEHERLYGHADPKASIDVINLRMVVVGAAAQPSLPVHPKVTGSPPARSISVWLDGGFTEAALYDRADLKHGHIFTTPCVIQQADTTTCVPAGFVGSVDRHHNLILTLEGGAV